MSAVYATPGRGARVWHAKPLCQRLHKYYAAEGYTGDLPTVTQAEATARGLRPCVWCVR